METTYGFHKGEQINLYYFYKQNPVGIRSCMTVVQLAPSLAEFHQRQLSEAQRSFLTIASIQLQNLSYKSPGRLQKILNRFKRCIRFRNQLTKRIRKRRIERIKEELVAQAWHPRRVERWLEAGCELEDL